MVYSAGTSQPATIEASVPHDLVTQVLPEVTPQSVDMHFQCPPVGPQGALPQVYERQRGLSAHSTPLQPRSDFADPWSSEFAHTYPAMMRLEALVNNLNDLEPLLDPFTMDVQVNVRPKLAFTASTKPVHP